MLGNMFPMSENRRTNGWKEGQMMDGWMDGKEVMGGWMDGCLSTAYLLAAQIVRFPRPFRKE